MAVPPPPPDPPANQKLPSRRIPETDYPKLFNLPGCVAYFDGHQAG